MAKLVKMSKSRGNVISPDEVIRGVAELSDDYEFRDLDDELIDWKLKRVWFDHNVGYRTSTKYGRQPVFLHIKSSSIPPNLTTLQTVQHAAELGFWIDKVKEMEALSDGNLG